MAKVEHISRPIFDVMARRVYAGEIMERRPCHTVTFLRRRFVITGAVGTGKGNGWGRLIGTEVVPASQYKGGIEPLDYTRHFIEIEKGARERSYTGMQITADGMQVVFVGPEYIFKPSEHGTQLEIF